LEWAKSQFESQRPNIGVKDQTMHTSLVGDEASQLFMRSPKLTKQNII